ncbi:hypothetical protein QBC46DRAFT_433285 [Diplogelasinospora grovesii]|uniref:PTM1-like N-terminal domain-containing protein n=1 Tax=Diplogelasinospora grovesii TaxID=303347 RepID=A0AAN6RY63_9PEZI|nr:hypothetical protein QBC46DRAFT_433285 [Diplogelasinospora grovesii]
MIRYFCDNETLSAGLCRQRDFGSFIGRTDLARSSVIVEAVHLQKLHEFLYQITQAGEYCVDIYGYDVEQFRAELDFHSPWGHLGASQVSKLALYWTMLALELLLLGLWTLNPGMGMTRRILALLILRIVADTATLVIGTQLNATGPGYSGSALAWFIVATPAAVWDAAISHSVLVKLDISTAAVVVVPAVQLGASLTAHAGFWFVDSKSGLTTLLRNIPATIIFVGYHAFAACHRQRRLFVILAAIGSVLMLSVDMLLLVSYLSSAGYGGDWLSKTWMFRWILVEEWRLCRAILDLGDLFLP